MFELLDETNPETMIQSIINPADLIPKDQNGHVDISSDKCSIYLKILFTLENLRVVHQHISLTRIIEFKVRYIFLILLIIKWSIIIYLIEGKSIMFWLNHLLLT